MVCIYCGAATRVTNSRLQKRNNAIWRRRLCVSCAGIFTTHERTELANHVVVAKNTGKLEPFSRDRLFITVYESCKHRPAALDDASLLTEAIMHDLAGSASLEPAHIAKTAHRVISRLDKMAANFYAAYHPAATQ